MSKKNRIENGNIRVWTTLWKWWKAIAYCFECRKICYSNYFKHNTCNSVY